MLASKLGIEEVADQIKGKRVLMRVDFNVPLKDGVVGDRTRIKSTIPSIAFALEKGAKKIILISHCGRPEGIPRKEFSLKPVAAVLEEELKKENIISQNNKVHFVEDCVGPAAEAAAAAAAAAPAAAAAGAAAAAAAADIVLLENLRFHVEEEGKGIDKDGNKIKATPEQVAAFKAQLTKVDMMIVAGGMAFTFKKVLEGMSIGSSLYDTEGEEIVKEIKKEVDNKHISFLLPSDFICADKFDEKAKTQIRTDKEGIPDGWMGLDIGPQTIKEAEKMIMKAKTIVWNGPPGVFEMEPFAAGSAALAAAAAAATAAGAVTIVGGGDTAAMVEKMKKAQEMSHISTGGGASLELLEGKELPGVAALSSK